MQDLKQEVSGTNKTRRLLDLVGIFFGLTALLFPPLVGILFHPTDHYFTSGLMIGVSMGLLPIAFNLMVLSIVLRQRSKELKRYDSEPEQLTTLLEAYLVKIGKHRIVLLTIGWLLAAKTVYETLIQVFNMVGLMTRVGEFSEQLLSVMLFQLGVSVVQGLIFTVIYFGLARFLKNQGLRLAAIKPEITTN